jgi:protein SEY1
MIKSTGWEKGIKHYNTVAIIGCQSSGKSTLLNALFETNFQVMAEDKGRGQTTQGIWVAMSPEYNVMILDCEGTDSKERGEERFKFEHCSSLFALALADVLIINMWTNVQK